MAQSNDLLIGGLALVGGVSLAKSAAEYGASITINNITHALGQPVVSLANIGAGKIDVTLPVYVLNSNAFSITIDRFSGRVSYGAVQLGTVEIPDQFTLVSGENVALDLFFTVDIASTVSNIFSSAQNGGLGILLDKLYLKGHLYIFGGSFFGQIEIPIETTIPIA